jgi:Uma2 family endonuclease
MAVRTAIPVEEYLRTAYEHDREYVRGEVVERGMPNDDHSKVQVAFVLVFGPLRLTKNLHVRTELRNRLAEDLVRIPDVAVYSPAPFEQVPTTPPLVAIEILSPDERVRVLLEKCDEYHRWGVKHVWVVDPERRRFQVFDGTDLRTVPQLELPEAGIIVTPAEVFD